VSKCDAGTPFVLLNEVSNRERSEASRTASRALAKRQPRARPNEAGIGSQSAKRSTFENLLREIKMAATAKITSQFDGDVLVDFYAHPLKGGGSSSSRGNAAAHAIAARI
jgi:hypothetical protein